MNYWKSVYSSDLDVTVPLGVRNGGLVQLMIRSLMSEDLCVWWNLCLYSPVLLIGFLSGCYFSGHLLRAIYMVWSSVTSSFKKVRTSTNESPLCLLLRSRVAIGIKRIERILFSNLFNCKTPMLRCFILRLRDNFRVLRSFVE